MTVMRVMMTVAAASLLVAAEALRVDRARRDDPWAAVTDAVDVAPTA